MKKNIYYITSDSWWDTDICIIPILLDVYNINVFVTSPPCGVKHPCKEIDGCDIFIENKLKQRNLHPISWLLSLKRIMPFYIKCKKDRGLIYYVFGSNIIINILLLATSSSSNTVICFHNYIEHVDKRKSIIGFLKKMFIKRFNKFHFQSEQQQNLFLKDYPFKKSFSTVMPLKVYGQPQNKIVIKKKGKMTFLFFGFIREYKRLDLFIEAANEIGKDAHFVIAGFCKEWDIYQKYIKNKACFSFYITFIDNDMIADLFFQSDFLVLPYDDATQSGPLLIAYEYKLPSIVSDQEYFKSMVMDEYNGYIFKTGDSNSLTNVMRRCLNLSQEDLYLLRLNQEKRTDLYIKKNNVAKAFQIFINQNF